MSELILFHHAQGLTDGVRAFAGELRGRDTSSTSRISTTAGPSPTSPRASATPRKSASGRSSSAVGSPPRGCRARSSTPAVPLQIHLMEADEWALPPNEDLEAARRLDETVESAELFVYAGDRYLFADNGLPDYDERAATLLRERVLRFLADVG